MILTGNGDPAWIWAGFLLAGLLWGDALRVCWRERAQWPFPATPLLIATLSLAVLWHIRAVVQPGMSLHLLGAMLCTMVFGARLALLPLSLALVMAQFSAGAEWSVLGLNACLLVFWPIALSRLVLALVARLPPNMFVFIFVGGFFGSAAVVLFTGWLISLTLWRMQRDAWGPMLEDYASYWLLVAFSEAWLTGMLVTVRGVYRPELVRLCDVRRYIDRA